MNLTSFPEMFALVYLTQKSLWLLLLLLSEPDFTLELCSPTDVLTCRPTLDFPPVSAVTLLNKPLCSPSRDLMQAVNKAHRLQNRRRGRLYVSF